MTRMLRTPKIWVFYLTTAMDYKEKLKLPPWQRKRLEVLNRDNFTCCICGETEKQIQVHHLYYLPDYDPWQYPETCYISVCEECHAYEHEIEKDVKHDLFLSFKKAGFTNASLIHIILGLGLMKSMPATPALVANAIGNMFGKREEITATYEKFK